MPRKWQWRKWSKLSSLCIYKERCVFPDYYTIAHNSPPSNKGLTEFTSQFHNISTQLLRLCGLVSSILHQHSVVISTRISLVSSVFWHIIMVSTGTWLLWGVTFIDVIIPWLCGICKQLWSLIGRKHYTYHLVTSTGNWLTHNAYFQQCYNVTIYGIHRQLIPILWLFSPMLQCYICTTSIRFPPC